MSRPAMRITRQAPGSMHWTDHKTVGLQYALTALALPARRFPADAADAVAARVADLAAAAGARRRSSAKPTRPAATWLPEFYNQLVAMHGTVMIFLAVVPLLTGAFGNYLVPLQIGASRHGVSAAQRRQLLDLPRRRPAHAARASS